VLAKRSINNDRHNRAAADREAAATQRRMRDAEIAFRAEKSVNQEEYHKGHSVNDHGIGPSREAASDPAPTRHVPVTEGQKAVEKSKYEPTEVFRSPKGDRLR
jgi:hypothetical protein